MFFNATNTLTWVTTLAVLSRCIAQSHLQIAPDFAVSRLGLWLENVGQFGDFGGFGSLTEFNSTQLEHFVKHLKSFPGYKKQNANSAYVPFQGWMACYAFHSETATAFESCAGRWTLKVGTIAVNAEGHFGYWGKRCC